MIEKIAFSVPGTGGNSIPVEGTAGMPSGGIDIVQIVLQWGLNLIFVAASLAALLFVIWGGISWITSGGEKEKIEEARKKIVYALIGLIIILASFMIVRTVGALFGGVDPFSLSGSAQTQCSNNNPHGSCSAGKECILFNGSYSCHAL